MVTVAIGLFIYKRTSAGPSTAQHIGEEQQVAMGELNDAAQAASECMSTGRRLDKGGDDDDATTEILSSVEEGAVSRSLRIPPRAAEAAVAAANAAVGGLTGVAATARAAHCRRRCWHASSISPSRVGQLRRRGARPLRANRSCTPRAATYLGLLLCQSLATRQGRNSPIRRQKGRNRHQRVQ